MIVMILSVVSDQRLNLATSLYQLPLNRVVERRLCREYYNANDPSSLNPDGTIDEELCKVDGVQRDLAWIIGVMETLWICGDFAMTIPVGFIAEKYGRRTVLWLNLVPRIFMLLWAVVVGYFEDSLPLKAIIAGPALSILGGDCVFTSIAFSLAASLTEDYVRRATYFGWMSAITYVVSFIGPSLAGGTMTFFLWLPFWIGIAFLILSIPVIYVLPDATAERTSTGDEQQRPLISSPTLKAQNASSSLATPIFERFRTLYGIVKSHPRNLLLLLISFLLTAIASSDTKLLAQYISKRYHWKFASAGYLLSGKAIVNFVLLTIIVPGVLKSRRSADHLQSQSLSDRANIRYARVCLAISVLGALAIALAETVWILFPSLLLYALGSALPVFTWGLLKSPSIAPRAESTSHNGETHIFSIATMFKTLGSLVGAPLMALLWSHGISTATLGTPYFVSAAFYTAAIVVFGGISVE
ncbi:MFS general substrate transporter [Xylariomycetidae sp. FL2044]|nr:MFS general substrate transporter [Xylariomycetidae sp. FL2044]